MNSFDPFEDTLRNATAVSVVFFDLLSDKLELELTKSHEEYVIDDEVDSTRSIWKILNRKYVLLKQIHRIAELINTFYGHFVRMEFDDESMKRLSEFKTNIFEENESDESAYKNAFSLLAKIEFEIYGLCSDQVEKSTFHKLINETLSNYGSQCINSKEYRKQFEIMKKQFESLMNKNKPTPPFNPNPMNSFGFSGLPNMNPSGQMFPGFDMMNSFSSNFPNQFMSSPFNPIEPPNMNFDLSQQTPENLFNNSLGMANQVFDFVSKSNKDLEQMVKIEQENKKSFKKFIGKLKEKLELLRDKLEKRFNDFIQILSQLDAEKENSGKFKFLIEMRDNYLKNLLSSLICKSNQIHEILNQELSNGQLLGGDESEKSNAKYSLLNKEIEKIFQLVENALKMHSESTQSNVKTEPPAIPNQVANLNNKNTSNSNIQVIMELVNGMLSLKCSDSANKEVNFGNEILFNGVAYQRKTAISNDQMSSLEGTCFRCTIGLNQKTNTNSVCLQILPKSEHTSELSEELKARLKRENAKAGTVQISLFWDNENDLDLHVIDPNQEEICYNHKKSRSGGELDVDMNASNVSRTPVENVVWPGQAPTGHYKVYVNYYKKKSNEDLTKFTVSVFANGVRKEFRNEMKKGDTKKLIHEFDLV